MLRHMAMEEIVPSALLAAATATLIFDIKTFRWPKTLRINALGSLRQQRRVFVQPEVKGGRVYIALPAPADRPAMDVMYVKDLGAAMHQTLFYGVSQVAA